MSKRRTILLIFCFRGAMGGNKEIESLKPCDLRVRKYGFFDMLISIQQPRIARSYSLSRERDNNTIGKRIAEERQRAKLSLPEFKEPITRDTKNHMQKIRKALKKTKDN